MNTLKFFVGIFCVSTLFACNPKPAGKVVVTNPSAADSLYDAQVVISKDSLKTLVGEIADNRIFIVADSTGKEIPSQVDDMNGDGKWDELAFVITLAPGETRVLNLTEISAAGAPKYKPRTQANFGKKLADKPVFYINREVLPKAPLPRGTGYPYKTDGPTWESDKAGYRHYFDGRNCRDFFCKLIPDMVLDTVGIWPDGTIGDTYHTLKTWGRDVLGVGQSFGLGGLAVMNGDSLVRLGVLKTDTIDNSDSTVFTLVSNGPVRSIIKLDFYGWDVGGTRLNVHQTVSIWAGRYIYDNQVLFDGDSAKKYLVTGLVHNNDSLGFKLKDYAPGFKALITHDQQTYNRQWFMGLALIVPAGSFIGTFDTPATGPGILYTYCTKLKAPFGQPLTFHAMAACELQDAKFRNEDEFIKTVGKEVAVLNNKLIVTLKR